MSFSFQAAGHRADVIASLRNTPTYGNQIGTAVRDAIISALEEDHGKGGSDGYEYVYIVKASGHSGGPGTATAQLNVTVESLYQATPATSERVSDNEKNIGEPWDDEPVSLPGKPQQDT